MSSTGERIIENPSWVQRLGSSFKGILTGFALFVAGIVLLFWNEGRAVDTSKRLKEGATAVIEVAADQIDPANEGKLVHVSGKANTQDVLSDGAFGISVTALRLKRIVEIYQTVEYIEKVKEGEKTREVPKYKDEWCSKPVDSSQFRNPAKRAANPPADMRFASEDKIAPNVKLGAFRISDAHVKRIGGLVDFSFPTNYVTPASMKYEKGARYVYMPVDSNELKNKVAQFTGLSRSVAIQPKPGDLRISFKVLMPCDVSIIHGQKDDALVPWTTPKGEVLELMVSNGLVPAKAMFAKAQSANATLTWVLRFVGILVMYFGLKGVLGPIDALVDVIPILGRVVAMGTSLAAFLVASACGLLTIGFSWIYHRPWIGIPLVVVGAALLVMVFLKKKKPALAA